MFPVLATFAPPSLLRLHDWFHSSLGAGLIQEQAPVVRATARRFHGDSLLWVGCQTPLLDTVRGCMIRNHFRLASPGWPDEILDDFPVPTFRAELTEIPLPNNALDALVLHHALEASSDPRRAIRECARVLAGGGRLLVCGFNPVSPWILRRLYARAFDDAFKNLRFVNPMRLMDWLAVLGFETEPVSYLAYNLPFGRGASQNRVFAGARHVLSRCQIPVGGVYVLSAVKQALAARPDLRPAAVASTKLAPVAYPKLSTWNRIERPR
jgi:SAM-dependent methyltransferase